MLLFRRRKTITEGSLNRKAWIRFRRNYVAMAGLLWIVVSALTAVAGYLVTPDKSRLANRQLLEIATRKPGFFIDIVHVRRNTHVPRQSWLRTMLSGRVSEYSYYPVQSWQFHDDLLVVESFSGEPGYPGMTREFRLIDILFAVADDPQPEMLQGDRLRFTDIDGHVHTVTVAELRHEAERRHIVGERFLLGTDRFGRDMLSQLIIGMRVSLSVGFIAVFISLLIGITLGGIGGYFRGRIDDLIVWVINVVWSVPTLLLVIAITFALGKGFWQVFVAVGLTMWVEVARVVRGQIISVREMEYVEAARALGLTHARIIIRHILPNIMGAVIVISAANFASAILIEAGLSFLGIGVQPPMPSWGTMIRDHYGYIILDKGFLAFLPGIMIMLMVLAFMVVGNGLKEALDKTAKA